MSREDNCPARHPWKTFGRICDIFSCWLTKHCVELLRVQVPLPPGCLVTLGLGIVRVVELWFCPKRIQHPQHAPRTWKKTFNGQKQTHLIMYISLFLIWELAMKPIRDTTINHTNTATVALLSAERNCSHLMHSITNTRLLFHSCTLHSWAQSKDTTSSVYVFWPEWSFHCVIFYFHMTQVSNRLKYLRPQAERHQTLSCGDIKVKDVWLKCQSTRLIRPLPVRR